MRGQVPLSPRARVHRSGNRASVGAASDRVVIDGYRMSVQHRLMPAIIALSAFATSAVAVTPDEALPGPKLELHARVISQDLRGVVFQNQNIYDSKPPVEPNLMTLLLRRLTACDSAHP